VDRCEWQVPTPLLRHRPGTRAARNARCTPVHLSDLNGCWDDGQQTGTGLKSLIRPESTRVVNGKSRQETRYYLSSLSGTAKQALQAVRSPWGVENSLHSVLDVTFNEDACRIRKDHAPANFSLLRASVANDSD
jgi:predicted transposase YbfD/YdcC